ncbi:hypothetical protein WOLCODRAFT_159009 [Wolfiporia cocos MD-104 SS10]|uniref:Uncharacterized protein n=1 Tax=Wolfiporia cocos (strain MD-104) TaxID=742152 RepID=A0A2H3JB30_WOLCO|nr:hypothetical protein WOLCODRAFT_159009 [Wolfiporia cocos MD-104 SS10]
MSSSVRFAHRAAVDTTQAGGVRLEIGWNKCLILTDPPATSHAAGHAGGRSRSAWTAAAANLGASVGPTLPQLVSDATTWRLASLRAFEARGPGLSAQHSSRRTLRTLSSIRVLNGSTVHPDIGVDINGRRFPLEHLLFVSRCGYMAAAANGGHNMPYSPSMGALAAA